MTPTVTPFESEFQCVLDARAALGECPIWSEEERVLYWVDIDAPALNRFDPQSERFSSVAMPSPIGSFALCEGGGFLLALRDGLWLANEQRAITRKIVDAPYSEAHHRFNDGRCDPQGRFVVGSMNEQRDSANAGLWRLELGRLMTLCSNITVSNSLCWSPDGRTMYHADTKQRTVWRYWYQDSDETPRRTSVFARWDAEADRPDGAAVDSEGNVWIALYRGGRVVRLSPDGRILSEHRVPAQYPTMCAFGGDDLRTLYVTTARWPDDVQLHPQAGGLFAIRTEAPGRPEYLVSRRHLSPTIEESKRVPRAAPRSPREPPE